jgi:hypothetical protein
MATDIIVIELVILINQTGMEFTFKTKSVNFDWYDHNEEI